MAINFTATVYRNCLAQFINPIIRIVPQPNSVFMVFSFAGLACVNQVDLSYVTYFWNVPICHGWNGDFDGSKLFLF